MVCSPSSHNPILCVWRHIFSSSARPDSLADCGICFFCVFPRPIHTGMDRYFSRRDTLCLASPILVCESVHKPFHQDSAASVLSHGSILFHGARCCRIDLWFLGLAPWRAVASCSVLRRSRYLGVCSGLLSGVLQEDGRCVTPRSTHRRPPIDFMNGLEYTTIIEPADPLACRRGSALDR